MIETLNQKISLKRENKTSIDLYKELIYLEKNYVSQLKNLNQNQANILNNSFESLKRMMDYRENYAKLKSFEETFENPEYRENIEKILKKWE